MTVYVGIDLHRKRSQVAVLSRLMGLLGGLPTGTR
jgi:hypothetical protein